VLLEQPAELEGEEKSSAELRKAGGSMPTVPVVVLVVAPAAVVLLGAVVVLEVVLAVVDEPTVAEAVVVAFARPWMNRLEESQETEFERVLFGRAETERIGPNPRTCRHRQYATFPW